MAKLSINEAAKRFDVSRPTLLKHLKNGYLSGEKNDAKGWQIDTSELARVYRAREQEPDKIPRHAAPTFSTFANGLAEELKAENERLKAALEERETRLTMLEARAVEYGHRMAAAEALADERKRLLDQLAPQIVARLNLPAPRRWWPW